MLPWLWVKAAPIVYKKINFRKTVLLFFVIVAITIVILSQVDRKRKQLVGGMWHPKQFFTYASKDHPEIEKVLDFYGIPFSSGNNMT